MSSENKQQAANNNASGHDPAMIEKYVKEGAELFTKAKEEIGKVYFGQENVVNMTLACMVANGHLLLEGVPGTGKTKLVSSISGIMGLEFNRTQFTPDLLPSDITGSEMLEHDGEGKHTFRFNKGPIFTQFFLADEINRAPGKTQAALLEAMEEKQVTMGGETYPLPKPFFTMATQNPIEQEGTYPLPEAQLDRFLIKLDVGYPQAEIEKRIMVEKTDSNVNLKDLYNSMSQGKNIRESSAKAAASKEAVNAVMSADRLAFYQQLASALPLSENVVEFTTDIIRAARPNTEDAIESVNSFVEVGPGPRTYMAFARIAKARALLDGRVAPDIDDIKAIAYPILNHRLRLNFKAESNNVTMENVVNNLVEHAENKQKGIKMKPRRNTGPGMYAG